MGEDGRQEHGPADDAASDSGDPLIGQTLAERYRIEGVIGSGAMGTVYAAEHVTMKRLVALKVMRPDLMKHERLIRRFQREAQASSRVVSPNVVLIYDFGHDESGRDFLAMERLSGESLGDVLRRDGSIPVLDAVGIAMGIARALEAAHSAGVVHRDLKPDNVFITEEGTVKVLDFGIAKIFEQGGPLEDMSTFTGIGAIAGTPLYMSPEAARRQPVGPPADLYTLGILLYQMISGSPPFEHDAPIMLMGMHIRSRPQRLSQRCPDLVLPASVDALVKDLLGKKPDARPTARQCLERLETCKSQLEERETGETSVMSRKELPLDEPLKPPPDAADGAWAGNVQDTVPTDQPVMYEDVLAEVERRKGADAEGSAAAGPAVTDSSGATPPPASALGRAEGAPPPPSSPASRQRDRPTPLLGQVPPRPKPASGLRWKLLAAVGAVVAGVALAAVLSTGDGQTEREPPTNTAGSASPEEGPDRPASDRPRPETARQDEDTPPSTEETRAPAETHAPPEVAAEPESERADDPEPDEAPDRPAASGSAIDPPDDRAAIRITSSVPARVAFDGEPTSHTTPATILRVMPGQRRIGLTTDDGREAELSVELVGGEMHHVHHDF